MATEKGRTAPRDFSRKWFAQAALFQAAARKCKLLHASALCKLLCASALSQVALRMCSVQVGLCKLLCASALCNCPVQFAERKLLCASDSGQVALRTRKWSEGKVSSGQDGTLQKGRLLKGPVWENKSAWDAASSCGSGAAWSCSAMAVAAGAPGQVQK